MARQIQQFRSRGKEFAMQHLGSEDELAQVIREIIASFSEEEMREMFPTEVRLKGLAPEERLKGLAPEQLIKALPPEELERLRELLLRQTKADDPTRPG
jgi:hypothetical protein